jgi:hypothetical protein
VVVATVYDDRKTPMAERLLFRQPENNLKVQVVADRTDYVPGDKVTLRVFTTTDTGKPVGAVVGLTVTDSSVLEMIEKREQAPRLPVMVLLEDDVRNLADAHVYLDESNPRHHSQRTFCWVHKAGAGSSTQEQGSSTVQSQIRAVRAFRA